MVKVEVGNSFLNKLQPRDILAAIVLIMCFVLMILKYNGYIQGVATLIIGYYFSKRVYEEKSLPK